MHYHAQTFLMACGITSLFAATIHLFYFPYSYHELLVAKYGCKREKSQEAKWRSTEKWKPMHEMERALDVDLFLEAQGQWAKDSPPPSRHTPRDVFTCCI